MLVMLLLMVSGAASGAAVSGVVSGAESRAVGGAEEAATPLPSQQEPDPLGLSGTVGAMGTKERLELVKKLLKQEPLIDG